MKRYHIFLSILLIFCYPALTGFAPPFIFKAFFGPIIINSLILGAHGAFQPHPSNYDIKKGWLADDIIKALGEAEGTNGRKIVIDDKNYVLAYFRNRIIFLYPIEKLEKGKDILIWWETVRGRNYDLTRENIIKSFSCYWPKTKKIRLKYINIWKQLNQP
jgi:hypothetical protein